MTYLSMYYIFCIIMYILSRSREAVALRTLRGRWSSQMCYKGDSSCIINIICIFFLLQYAHCWYHIIEYERLETVQIFPHCEHVGPYWEESEHNKRELMELAAVENACRRYKESMAAVRISGGDLRRTRYLNYYNIVQPVNSSHGPQSYHIITILTIYRQ